MDFPADVVDTILVQCHRRCCVCHKYCGINIELHHIQPKDDGGDSTADNAIALCFDCHAEVGHYNNRHPRGRKFRSSELKGHRDQWIRICMESPGGLQGAPRFHNLGPLEAVLSELRLNNSIAAIQNSSAIGCPFEVDQIRRGLAQGAFLALADNIQEAVHAALIAMLRANTLLSSLGYPAHPRERAAVQSAAQKAIQDAEPSIHNAIATLEAL